MTAPTLAVTHGVLVDLKHSLNRAYRPTATFRAEDHVPIPHVMTQAKFKSFKAAYYVGMAAMAGQEAKQQ